jgi:hypothetical protein
MAVFLSPVGGVAAQFFTSAGAVLTGGKLYTYAAGTTTPAATYTTSNGTTSWTNPVVLDAAGRVSGSGEIWLTGGVRYKFVLTNANDVLIATYDNINGAGSIVIISYTGTGSQVAFSVSGSVASVFINGVYQNQNTYSISGTTLTFSQAPPFTSKIEIQTV